MTPRGQRACAPDSEQGMGKGRGRRCTERWPCGPRGAPSVPAGAGALRRSTGSRCRCTPPATHPPAPLSSARAAGSDVYRNQSHSAGKLGHIQGIPDTLCPHAHPPMNTLRQSRKETALCYLHWFSRNRCDIYSQGLGLPHPHLRQSGDHLGNQNSCCADFRQQWIVPFLAEGRQCGRNGQCCLQKAGHLGVGRVHVKGSRNPCLRFPHRTSAVHSSWQRWSAPECAPPWVQTRVGCENACGTHKGSRRSGDTAGR